MLVRDLATEDPKTVTPEFSVRNVLDLLRNNDFRHVPVVGGRRTVRGILSETDLVSSASMARMFGQSREAYESFLDVSVDELLKTRFSEGEGPYTVGPDEPAERAVRSMLEHSVSALPVVEDHGTLYGIISYVDVLHEIFEGEIELDGDKPGEPDE